MPTLAVKELSVREAAEMAARDLITVKHWGGSSFLNLPLIYPDGSFVTVKLDRVPSGFRVSDNGFAYREAECLGVQRSFPKTAGSVAEAEGLTVNRRAIYTDVTAEGLSRAICDIATASWLVADRIIGNISEEAEAEIEEHLSDRLVNIFGSARVKSVPKLIGASTSEWEVSAIVEMTDHRTVFQAVANHANSVFRVSTAFRDLAALDRPPKLVAVVHDKATFGPKLNLLAQEGRVIEDKQSDDVFLRAAA